ncbi:hypothetical protein N7457_000145 [Penicillium paradoxum]|uniref:uncharacterized protein n=1 Tax=Penicillium paradoxum TaxID=176176 RepID=UPI0025480BD1|nr:uncharacterized protein N7457_000145 [Penicillium paradoxum]KAJ5793546.1 hypothetical protein N7457_000145 [Penicillium paradoxum]
MSNDSKGNSFPDVSAKLSALPKKSLFERQKAEVEAKRAREKAETAAVYEDFVKSFEDEAPIAPRSLDGGSGYPRRASPPRRHFAASALRHSGPGTLGPSHSSFSQKRSHASFSSSHRDHPKFPNMSTSSEADRVVDDEERAAAKPTLYLASLPPGTSLSVIKALISPTLTVDNVKILSQPEQPSTARRSSAALVTLASDSAASQIDATVSALQKKYLGFGYYLDISRHLSSAVSSSRLPLPSTASLPFGATPIPQNSGASFSRAPPPGLHRGGIAPPSSYGPQGDKNAPTTQVQVKLPKNLGQLRQIHKTIEYLINHGPEFEALLMSRPDIQQDEKWSWLYDARSAGGVYYRWKLWQVITDPKQRNIDKPAIIFEGGPLWLPPKHKLKFEYVTKISEFVTHPDYNSSDEEHSDGENERRNRGGAASEPDSDAPEYLNPLKMAKLTHLLARLPPTNTKLRRGDVARVTAFAIENARAGANEVVDLVVRNVFTPLIYSAANPNRDAAKKNLESTHNDDSSSKESLDTPPAKLVALYIISDILSAASTSGVRQAWRYRQLFEAALRERKVFEHLGRLDKDFNWGRMKADKWKRSVGSLLHLWEGWCCFTQSAQAHFTKVFETPPLTESELQNQKETEKTNAERAAVAFAKSKNRWKTVDDDKRRGKSGPTRPVDKNGQSISNAGTNAGIENVPVKRKAAEESDDVPMGARNEQDSLHLPKRVKVHSDMCDQRLSIAEKPMLNILSINKISNLNALLIGVKFTTQGMPVAGKAKLQAPSLGNEDTQIQHPHQPPQERTQSSEQSEQSAEQHLGTRRRKPRPKAEDMFASDSE